jgi:hypothetical protein
MTRQLQTPVVMMVFNRPDLTRLAFREVAETKPRKLLVIADGPRASRPGEDLLCSQVCSIFKGVDWPCEVLTHFADSNLGCRERVISGLTWAFSQVEEAIILEDDCLPDQTFFVFCQELLERYRGDSRVSMISGHNCLPSRIKSNYSYHFSRVPHTGWGWATWCSAWQRYDRNLENWETVKQDGILSEIYSRNAEAEYWSGIFESMHLGTGPNTWDYQWVYTNLLNNLLSIRPSVNMVSNIGFGKDATHTHDPDSEKARLQAHAMTFPLRHPPYMVPMRSFDDLDQQISFVPRFGRKVKRKLRSLRRRLLKHSNPGSPIAIGNETCEPARVSHKSLWFDL